MHVFYIIEKLFSAPTPSKEEAMLKNKLLIIKLHSFFLSLREKFTKSNSISVLREIKSRVEKIIK